MAKFPLFLATVVCALVLVAAGLFGLGSGHASRPVGKPNFACAGYGNWGICIGPPTNN